MSKYDSLWKWISENKTESFTLTYDEIEKYGKIPIDHSFLKFKKELEEYGFRVDNIKMKEKRVFFVKI